MKRICLLLSLLALFGGAGNLLACTTAIVSAEASESGRPMIWKQRDASNIYNCLRHVSGPHYDFTAVFPVKNPNGKSAYGGINTAGFAIANNMSYNLNEEDSDKNPRNGLFMYLALGQCATLSDFETLLENRPDSIQISSNFAVIDAQGGAAYFEAGNKGWTRFDVPKGGILYRTNFSLSGKENDGTGYARYEAISKLMKKAPRGGYKAEFFLDVSRRFYDGINGKDALRGRKGYLYDRDFIPRTTSASSLVIEGVSASDRADSGLMWFVAGYPPCGYGVACWVAAGEMLPACISGTAPANALAADLMHRVHPFPWKGSENFLEIKTLKAISSKVRKAEKTERSEARRYDGHFRREGFDPEWLRRYNAEADARFLLFKTSVAE